MDNSKPIMDTPVKLKPLTEFKDGWHDSSAKLKKNYLHHHSLGVCSICQALSVSLGSSSQSNVRSGLFLVNSVLICYLML